MGTDTDFLTTVMNGSLLQSSSIKIIETPPLSECGALKIFYGNARPLCECKVLCACICVIEMAGEQ